MKGKKETMEFNPRAIITGMSGILILGLKLLKINSMHMKSKKDFTPMLRR
jgi:hypothetical protein